MRLSDRVVVVTGAGGGLGGAIAELFASEGAAVAVNDVREDTAEHVAERCRAASAAAGAPARSRALVGDVADPRSVAAMFAHVEQWWGGRLDVLVNNAGVSATSDVPLSHGEGAADGGAPAPLERGVEDITDEQWRRMLGVHLDGTFYCTRAAVPLMKRRGSGSIVCMSSIAGTVGFGPIHYSAAKGGILGFVRSVARTVGPAGIRINAVCPGAIDAGMTHAHAPEVRESIVPSIPQRRLGTALDIAYAALYLASDESAYTTGQHLSPNGGLVIT